MGRDPRNAARGSEPSESTLIVANVLKIGNLGWVVSQLVKGEPGVMQMLVCLMGMYLAVQVPSPATGVDRAAEWKATRKSILERERRQLQSLAEHLTADRCCS